MSIEALAATNFERHLVQNPYPGRGLVIGKADENTWLMIYWIMGRSTNSRNRRFVVDGQTMRTEPVDLSLVADPSLIIYEVMLNLPGIYIVSNGDQTRTIHDALKAGGTFEAALSTREREPDAPNFTPRISAMLRLENGTVSTVLSILKANPLDPAYSDRYYFYPSMPKAGFGLGLTTYSGDGNPLPSFSGEPLLLPLVGTAEQVLETYWNALNAENRISLAVKEVSVPSGTSRILVKNRY